MTTRVDVVERALGTFLQEHEASSSSSLLDEIVLNYVAGIADDISLLDADRAEEDDSFDVEEFVEMMDAYLPGFAMIPGEKVQEWMFNLAKLLQESGKDVKPSNMDTHEEVCSGKEPDSVPSSSLPKQGRRIPVEIPSPTPTPDSGERGDHHDEAVSLLLEMFPATCQVEVLHCLGVAGGNVDEAAELVLCRQMSGENIKNPLHSQPPRKMETTGKGDEDIKQKIVNQYMFSYVDGAATSGGSRNEHKMTLSLAEKKEPKKLVRYLDSKVVNTKGQRFTEVKKPESEELKKTYINLKPARQYRFH